MLIQSRKYVNKYLSTREAPIRVEENEVGLLVTVRHQQVAVRLVRHTLINKHSVKEKFFDNKINITCGITEILNTF